MTSSLDPVRSRSIPFDPARSRSIPLDPARCRRCRRYFLRVRAAFLAARDFAALDRVRAAARACLDNALRDPAARPSRFKAAVVARERFREGDLRPPFWACFVSRIALRRVASETVPFLGGDNFTPARRAFDRPIATACLVDRAPCLPCRTCSISSRTNSPACVEGALPSRSASWARSRVSSSGIVLFVRFSRANWSCVETGLASIFYQQVRINSVCA